MSIYRFAIVLWLLGITLRSKVIVLPMHNFVIDINWRLIWDIGSVCLNLLSQLLVITAGISRSTR